MTDTGYDEWVDAVGEDAGYYLRCPSDHGSLPPRRTCPYCGATELDEEALPETGELETFTVVHVGAPEFESETPYVTAIASFGPVRLTGVVANAAPDEIAVGDEVEADVGVTEATGGHRIEFTLR